jgi:hypothetical protein
MPLCIHPLTLARALPLAFLLAVLSGCASVSPEQLAAVEAKINAASKEAQAAKKEADAAMQRSSEAAAAADRAQGTADSATTCCRETSDKIDRAFTKKMKK